MAVWVRFEQNGQTRIGTVEAELIALHLGDMFAKPTATGERIPANAVRLQTPCRASKMICLWNNFPALATKLGVEASDEPLYAIKAPSAFLAHGETIRRPASYDGNGPLRGVVADES